MLALTFPKKLRVLCLGAHSDDIEIGCGGTLLKLAEECEHLEVIWVVFSAEGERAKEARKSANSYLRNVARAEVVVKDFRGSLFPYEGEKIKSYFETLKAFEPDLVFTHFRDDRHQDHRVISDLSWNTFRNHLILEYEIPKYDGDLGAPTVFVSLDKKTVKKKTKRLRQYFQTQGNKHWFAEETFSGLMRLRGMECASGTGYAEGFYARKLTVGAA